MIPPEQNGSFVAHMEMVLDVYKRPLDPIYPVVCMDESPKQLMAETKVRSLSHPERPLNTIMNTALRSLQYFYGL